VLRTFHKTTRFDEKLRSIEQLCGPGFSLSVNKLQKILGHFKRQNMVLLVERDEMSPLGMTLGVFNYFFFCPASFKLCFRTSQLHAFDRKVCGLEFP